MQNPNKGIHIDWITTCTREDAVYDYPKLSIEECETIENLVQEMLSIYDEGNERVDVAEMICMMASIFASRSVQEQQGILISSLSKSQEIHTSLYEEDQNKEKTITDLLNSKE
jgi:hypothetical protein